VFNVADAAAVNDETLSVTPAFWQKLTANWTVSVFEKCG